MNLLKKVPKEEATHHRTKYVDQTTKFVDWVNALGLERTWFGRVLAFFDEKFMVRRFALVFMFSLALALLLTMNLDFVFVGYKTGDLVGTDIKSPLSFEFVDEVETAQKKKEAEDLVPAVYDLDPNAFEPVVSGVYNSFREMRKILAGKPWPSNEVKKEEAIKDFLRHKDRFDEILGHKRTTMRQFEWLVANRFRVSFENVIIRLLDQVTSEKIVADLIPLKDQNKDSIIVRVVERGGEGEEFTVSVKDIRDVYSVRKSLNLKTIRGTEQISGSDQDQILRITEALISPNLTLNLQETTNSKQSARDSVLPVVISIKKNQLIISEGSMIQPVHERLLDEIARRKSKSQRDFEALVMAIFFITMILVFFSYLRRFTLNKVRVDSKDLVVMGIITIVIVLLSKVSLFVLAETLQHRFGIFIPSMAFWYLLPVFAGPMLVGLLITSGEIVWLFTVFMATVLTFMMELSFPYLIVTVVGGIAAARGVFNCKKRNDVYLAGLRVGVINVLTILLVTVITAQTQEHIGSQIFWNCAAGFVSGVGSSFVALMFIPLLETAFNYTTDVRLLELSNLNHPLLKEMSVKALGTYHHSLVVGSMVETAAEAIGANSLMGRVASYFHDIGKTEHAAYFIENQKPQNNPHDHLSPNMSKTILIAHVKDGVELGLQYKLGKPIIDVIQQHHGTTLISFFYNRAQENNDESMGEITEEEYRYPGPKPQIRESALCMLADSIEAAARTLDEPNPVRLRNMVKTIIQRKFMDAQLDECNLSLRDLSIIENCFVRVLIGIYHQRVDYPRHLGGVGKD